MWLKHMRLMQAETGGDGGAGGGGTAGDGAGGNDAAAPTDGSQDSGAPSGQDAGSLLGQRKDAAPAPSEWLPEKYQVKADDGALDIEASARKLAEAHGHLEKRLGAGDLPPKTAAEYKVTPPETMGDYKPEEDAGMTAFLEDAHKAGMTQGQIDAVMKHYFAVAPTLAGAARALDEAQATEALQKVWGTDEREFKRHAGLAFTAASAAAERAKISMEDIEAAGLGNNPVFLRLMSALGSEFREDKGAGSTSFQVFGEDQVRELETSEAYTNPRHPDHEKVSGACAATTRRSSGLAPWRSWPRFRPTLRMTMAGNNRPAWHADTR